MTNFVYIATSLDGYIAKSDGDISWLTSIPSLEGDDYGFADFMKKIDAIVMGRKTFEDVNSFNSWPYKVPVIVLSNSLKLELVDLKGRNLSIMIGEPKEIVKTLNEKGYKNLYIDGGITIQKFLAEDLIDELIITRVPILLGNGRALFANSAKEITLKHIETIAYPNGLVKSHYRLVN